MIDATSTGSLILGQLNAFSVQAYTILAAVIGITVGIFVYYWAKRHFFKGTRGH